MLPLHDHGGWDEKDENATHTTHRVCVCGRTLDTKKITLRCNKAKRSGCHPFRVAVDLDPNNCKAGCSASSFALSHSLAGLSGCRWVVVSSGKAKRKQPTSQPTNQPTNQPTHPQHHHRSSKTPSKPHDLWQQRNALPSHTNKMAPLVC